MWSIDQFNIQHYIRHINNAVFSHIRLTFFDLLTVEAEAI